MCSSDLRNPNLKQWVEEIVREEDLKTYHHLAPKGLSTAFSRTFTSNPSGNSTFSNAIEMNGKILKRSSFDVYVQNQDDAIQPLSVNSSYRLVILQVRMRIHHVNLSVCITLVGNIRQWAQLLHIFR